MDNRVGERCGVDGRTVVCIVGKEGWKKKVFKALHIELVPVLFVVCVILLSLHLEFARVKNIDVSGSLHERARCGTRFSNV